MTSSSFQWQRTLKSADFYPLCQVGYLAEPKTPHDAKAHDRELLESHFGDAVASLESWHFYGRRFVMSDGKTGIIDARSSRVDIGTTHALEISS